jgi:hypothetical protein
MDFSKYNFFYVNGCSHSEGGGLEPNEIRGIGVIPIYKELYGVNWNHTSEVNFGKRLEEIIGIKCINEAKSGGSTARVVRMTYDFIYKNWKNKDKFFIILEKPDSSRSDVFSSKHNQYYIVNSLVENSIHKLAGASRDYFNLSYREEDDLCKPIFENWYNNHYSFENNAIQDEKDFVGLYSFCKLNNIKIILMNGNGLMFHEAFDTKDIIKFSNKNQSDDIHSWCVRNKKTITDEVSDKLKDYIDTHPGYFGHIEYAKLLANFLGWESKEIKNKII